MIEKYLLNRFKGDLKYIISNENEDKHFSLNLNFVELFENDTNIGDGILKEPDKTLEDLNKCLVGLQQELKSESVQGSEKLNIHCRVYGLPACPELHRTIFPRNEDLGMFLQVTGTVVRITTSKMLEYQKNFICTKCKYKMLIQAEYETRYVIKQPKKCANLEGCPGTNIISANNLEASNCKDYQEIKIQEQVSKLSVGSMPNSMWVTLEDDLVDICKPGDDVTICGIVKRRWGSQQPGKKLDIDLVFKANHVQVNNNHTYIAITPEVKEQFETFWTKHSDCPLFARDLILKSFCPQLYGLYIVKLATVLILAGGSESHNKDNYDSGVQVRSEPHLLLVGDPGTGKSQLLRFASKVVSRSVLTTGIGSTSAGLTVTAFQENGEWQLEGGALVLSDGGICCIDEFNSMKEHDRTSIHEAMEQQTISVAKASIVCKLSTRCSILAATNPKGNLDPLQPLSMNINLASPLLSRFDLILLLQDTIDNEWDDLITDYILNDQSLGGENVPLWTVDMLQAYFSVIKGLHPKLTPEANRILSTYYQAQRRVLARNKARTTVRLLDSLVRLSQAHARLMFHRDVHVMDAVFAVILVESSMQGQSSILELDINSVQCPFPQNPSQTYLQLLRVVLSRLGLFDILENEVDSFANCSNKKNYKASGDNFLKQNDTSNKITSQSSNNIFNDSMIHENSSLPETSASDTYPTTFEMIEKNNKDIDRFRNENISNTDSEKFIKNLNNVVTTDSTISGSLSTKKASKNECDQTNDNINNLKKTNDNIVDSNIFTITNEQREDPSELKQKRLKRDNKPNEKSKKIKLGKNMTDLQMINLLPSVNDIFNIDDMNPADDEFEINQNAPVMPETKVEQVQVSQNTKMKIFKEKFKFKPRPKSVLQVKETVPLKKNRPSSFRTNSDGEISSQTSSLSLFCNNDEDFDNLDLDL